MGLLDWLKPPTWAAELQARVDHVRDVLGIVLDHVDDGHRTAREGRDSAVLALRQLAVVDTRIHRMEITMSADRDFLNELAQDLSDLTAPVDALLASEAALRARVAELEGDAAADEAGDLAAAQPVRDQLNLIAGKFAAKPDLPDVTTPEEPAPVDEPVVDEPAPADPETPADPENNNV